MNSETSKTLMNYSLRRRAFLTGIGGALVGGLLAACAGGATPTSAPATPTPASATTPTPAPATRTPAAVATPTVISSPATSSEPIRIGLIHGYTGVFAALAENLNRGIQLYFESVSNVVAGRGITLIQEDDASNPEQGLTKLRQLVERDKVDLITIIGFIQSGVALACRDYIHQVGIPTFIDNAGA